MPVELYGPVGAGGGFGPGFPSAKFVEVGGVPVTGFTSVADMTAASFSHRPMFQPFYQPGQLSVKTVRMYLSRTAGITLNVTAQMGFYIMGNSTSLSLISSQSQRYSLTASTEWSGIRAIEFTGLSNMVLTQGQWFMGFQLSASNTSTAVGQVQLLGPALLATAVTAGTIFTGNDQTSAPAASNLLEPFLGVYSVTSAALPANVGASEIIGSASGQAAPWYALIKEV